MGCGCNKKTTISTLSKFKTETNTAPVAVSESVATPIETKSSRITYEVVYMGAVTPGFEELEVARNYARDNGGNVRRKIS